MMKKETILEYKPQVCVPTSLYFRRYYWQEMKKDVKLGGYVLLEKLQT